MNSSHALNISSSQLSELIGDIYSAVTTANWNLVLGKLADYTRSNKAFCMFAKLGDDKPLLLEFHNKKNYPSQPLLEYQSRPFDDPFYVAIKDMAEGDALFVNDYVDINEHINTEYYQTVFKPLECHYVIGGLLCRDGQNEAYYGMHRGISDLAFSDEDKNLVSLITPHFRNAMRMFKDLKMYKDYACLTDSILDQSSKAIFVCDEHCNTLKTNKYAEDLLKQSELFNLDNGKLCIDHSVYHNQLLERAFQSATLAFSNIGSHHQIIIEENNNTRAIITLSPLRGNSDFVEISQPCCLVSIEISADMPWHEIQQTFTLTPKEIELLKKLNQGKTLREFAKETGTSYNTQRSHLQKIFKKVLVNSQTELMIKLNSFKQ